jgi:hypothetical protein
MKKSMIFMRGREWRPLLFALLLLVGVTGAFAQYDEPGIAIGARGGVFAHEIGDSFSTGNTDFGKNTLPNVGAKDSQIFTAKDQEKIKPAQLAAPDWAAFMLNFFVGVGVGSYAQGDITGGVIGTVGEVGGLGMMISGLAMSDGSPGTGAVISLTGLGIFLGTRIFELIRPWTYD